MELKEEIKRRKYLRVDLSIEVIDDDIEVKIGHDHWRIKRIPPFSVIRNDLLIATRTKKIQEPWNKALDAMYAEIDDILSEFKEIIHQNLTLKEEPPEELRCT